MRLLFLFAGVSYYKTTAAPVIDLGDLPTTAAERDFLRAFYVNGLGEFAYRNGLDLRGLRVEGPDAGTVPPVAYEPDPGRPLDPLRRRHRFDRHRGGAGGGPPRRRALRGRAPRRSASPPLRTRPP